MTQWTLEGYFDGDDVMRRLPVHHFPFRIGRQPGLELSLNATELSRVHAELFEDGGMLFVRDLDSTNGTFVNHKAVRGERALRHGDVVQLANVEFRVLGETTAVNNSVTMTMAMAAIDSEASKLPTGLRELQELIDMEAATAVFQSIVSVGDDSVYAYEVLGRGDYSELPQSPGELFRIAESAGLEVPLSELLRVCGVKSAVQQETTLPLFLNTHPRELKEPDRLMTSLEQLRALCGELPLVLEIHEQGVTDLGAMVSLRQSLQELSIGLAYDDFGAGQARLLELIEATPDFLKFDMAFIRNLDKAPEAKLQMIESLLAMTAKMGIPALAEGASREEEVAVCKRLGFDYIQGFYYGRPAAGIPPA